MACDAASGTFKIDAVVTKLQTRGDLDIEAEGWSTFFASSPTG